MTTLKPNIKFKNQFEQWKLPKTAAKVRHFWFHFTNGKEVWELLFHDVETRTFCITLGVIHLVGTSKRTDNLIPLPLARTCTLLCTPIVYILLPTRPQHLFSKFFPYPINNSIGKVILYCIEETRENIVTKKSTEKRGKALCPVYIIVPHWLQGPPSTLHGSTALYTE